MPYALPFRFQKSVFWPLSTGSFWQTIKEKYAQHKIIKPPELHYTKRHQATNNRKKPWI
jgi:hypothetical protein